MRRLSLILLVTPIAWLAFGRMAWAAGPWPIVVVLIPPRQVLEDRLSLVSAISAQVSDLPVHVVLEAPPGERDQPDPVESAARHRAVAAFWLGTERGHLLLYGYDAETGAAQRRRLSATSRQTQIEEASIIVRNTISARIEGGALRLGDDSVVEATPTPSRRTPAPDSGPPMRAGEQRARTEGEQRARTEGEQRARTEGEQRARTDREQRARTEGEQTSETEDEQHTRSEDEQHPPSDGEQHAWMYVESSYVGALLARPLFQHGLSVGAHLRLGTRFDIGLRGAAWLPSEYALSSMVLRLQRMSAMIECGVRFRFGATSLRLAGGMFVERFTRSTESLSSRFMPTDDDIRAAFGPYFAGGIELPVSGPFGIFAGLSLDIPVETWSFGVANASDPVLVLLRLRPGVQVGARFDL